VQASLIEFASFYESYDIDALRFSDSHCWAAFGPANGEYRRVAHQTTSISSDGLRVFVNVELKAATDRFKAVLNNYRGKPPALPEDSQSLTIPGMFERVSTL